MFDGVEDTRINALPETAFGLETRAIHLHSCVFEGLTRQNFNNEDSFGFCQFHSIHTHNSQFSRFAHRVFLLHVKSRVASGQKRVGLLAQTRATRLCCLELPMAPCMVWLFATTSWSLG